MNSAGFDCVRADEIQHSGVIDVPMYERLLNADLVVADLSTLNVNAFFELGVRYALNQWGALTQFLTDGDLEIDNGASERANRGVAVAARARRSGWSRSTGPI